MDATRVRRRDAKRRPGLLPGKLSEVSIRSTTTPESFLPVPCACEEGNEQREPLPYEEGNVKQTIKLRHMVLSYTG